MSDKKQRSLNGSPKPLVLCILDGWGISDSPDSPMAVANTSFLKKLIKYGVNCKLEASGVAVGLPEGQMGNSEVGHLSIGSGRVVLQTLPRINEFIENQGFSCKKEIKKMVIAMNNNQSTCHVMGLISDGGVHSHIAHLLEVISVLYQKNIRVKLHLFTDGRDVSPDSAHKFISELEGFIEDKKGLISIATLCGRFYAMDRDNRWDRTEAAYNAIVKSFANRSETASQAITQSYLHGKYDEFIIPTVIGDYAGMNDDDGLIMVNFRADRVRQLLSALLVPEFTSFSRMCQIQFSYAIAMTEYSHELNQYMDCLFPDYTEKDTLGEILSLESKRQLRIAETEKYAHVTYFFNAGIEEPFKGEERILVQSPAVETYDKKPEMSALEITKIAVDKILNDNFDFIVINYANADMVGHSGNFAAVVKAIEVVDSCLEKVFNALREVDGMLLVTSDHGNAETLRDKNNQVHTAHTCNPVPFIISESMVDRKKILLNDGALCDIAPTILEIMKISKPLNMSGKSLIVKNLSGKI